MEFSRLLRRLNMALIKFNLAGGENGSRVVGGKRRLALLLKMCNALYVNRFANIQPSPHTYTPFIPSVFNKLFGSC